MKNTKLDEKVKQNFDAVFENDFENRQISVFQNESALEHSQNEAFLDNFLSLIKLTFLYIPGAMTIHFVGIFVKFLILYPEPFPNLWVELSGFAIIGTFLTMLGIGKLNDLNFLKVPAAILAMSLILSLIHIVITLILGFETEGWFWATSFPIVVIWGYIVKKLLEKE